MMTEEKIMHAYNQNETELFESLSTGLEGLSEEKYEEVRKEVGENKLAEKKKTPLIRKFFEQIVNPMNLVLIATALISAGTSLYTILTSGESFAVSEFVDVFIIVFVVLLNGILGVVQEAKAEKSLDALKAMTVSSCRVLRGGKIEIVDEKNLVPGDLVLLEAGNIVPADGRIIEAVALKIDEAMLTGESVPSEKNAEIIEETDVPLAERKNMAYMGTPVVYGRGKMIVTAIGMKTEMGKIAEVLSEDEKEITPLQKKLNELSKILTYLVLIICAAIFLIGVIRGLIGNALTFDSVLDSFMVAVSLAVASIPEGLVSVVTIVLSLGVSRMSKKNAIVKKLTAVETLGCTKIICTDKTGTLTMNKMTVVDVYGHDPELLNRILCLCNDAEIGADGNVSGEPTETALVEYALKNGVDKGQLALTMPRVGELPFDSLRKRMSTVHRSEKGYVQYTKGALDCLMDCCSSFLDEEGKIVALTEEIKEKILRVNADFASRALRVLAGAYKECDSAEPEEANLIFVGMAGMIDPIRPEVKEAVSRCREAGIRVIMITGDHVDTARAIGKELGLLSSGEEAITGKELDALTDEEFESQVEKYAIYARVQPEHKTKVVRAWKKKGQIVAMTGDGVNDAPSIKSADIGIGMGITGTEVTKIVADMVLSDDNFATITAAVEEGRKIYDNIQKAIRFLLSSNLAEVIAILIATLSGFTLLEPTHLLWINLITDSLPALALGLEQGEKDLMKRKPREENESVFAHGSGIDIAFGGLLIGGITLLSYLIGHYLESGQFGVQGVSYEGMTMAFLTLSMCEIVHCFNMRSQRESLFRLRKNNVYLIGAGVLALVLSVGIIYIPGINTMFKFQKLDVRAFFIAIGLSLCVLVVYEIYKGIARIIDRKRSKK